MATYTAIANSEVDPDSPLTSTLMTRLRDNPIAIAEGRSGAPRIEQAAMGDWFYVAANIGSYVFARGSADTAFGDNVAGSSLNPISAIAIKSTAPSAIAMPNGASLSGTWKCMGRFTHTQLDGEGGSVGGATLYQRIA